MSTPACEDAAVHDAIAALRLENNLRRSGCTCALDRRGAAVKATLAEDCPVHPEEPWLVCSRPDGCAVPISCTRTSYCLWAADND